MEWPYLQSRGPGRVLVVHLSHMLVLSTLHRGGPLLALGHFFVALAPFGGPPPPHQLPHFPSFSSLG